ncbi:hypothetical protein [Rubritepida flocculans]|uniref:hypothetical protein n=1 Tax=Rubritepida flocculans TaxID=182403 RepID=UPI00040B4A30|nr:hypothetical protein [Rubritepida flocculans]
MRARGIGLGLLLLLLLAGAPAGAETRVGVRTGDHPGFGRIVFDWAAAPAYRVEEREGVAILRFPPGAVVDLSGARRLPRNLLGVREAEGGIELRLAPGARLRHFRNGPKVAVDILDPTPETAAPARAQAAAPAPAPTRPAAPAPAARPPAAAPAAAPPPAVPPPARPAEASAAPAAARLQPAEALVAPRPAPPAAAAPASAVPAAATPTPTAPAPAAASPVTPPLAAPAMPRAETPRPQPAEVQPARPAAAPAVTPPPPHAAPIPAPEAPPIARAAEPAAARAAPSAPPAAVAPPPATATLPSLAGPAPIRARLVPRPGLASAFRLPGTAEVGAAAFRRGERVLLVLDTERPLELGTLPADRAYQGAEVQRLPGAVVLSWRLPADQRLTLTRENGDWLVTPGPRLSGVIEANGIRPRAESGLLVLPAPRAARVVALTDAQTGLPLLVGTLLQEGARQAVTRSHAEFDLIETFLGAAVLARSDGIGLRAGAERFVLAGAGNPMQAVTAAMEGAASLTRSFDFPAEPAPALLERLRAQQAALAAAPPLRRVALRLQAAETLLALGMPQEAQAMLRVAGQENAEALQDPRLHFLSGAAALLAGRAGEASGLDAPMPPSDEVMLWRAAREAVEGEMRPAAAGFAAAAPLLLAYPEGLRRRLLPLAVEAMAAGGEPEAARRLLARAGEDPSLLLAQALLAEAEGQQERALELFDAAANTRDRLMRARALRLGVERRLAMGRLDVEGAAQALERALGAWRGDAQELRTRERIAALRREAGQPRAALEMLRETAQFFPDQAAALRPRLQEAFLHALESEAPLQAVALHEAHPELLPAGETGRAALERLAQRLIALDLADRAAAMLARAMEPLPAGEARAALGADLAALHMSERNAEAALAALAASGARGLSAPLLERRAILAARAQAQRGQHASAAEALAALGPAGDRALADILMDARDHAGAAAALARHLAASAPPPPTPLSADAQRDALRLAALLALAGDEAGLAQHRARFAGRLSEPALAEGFEALTADPVRGLADLPRIARELELFRGIPARPAPLRTAQSAPR